MEFQISLVDFAKKKKRGGGARIIEIYFAVFLKKLLNKR